MEVSKMTETQITEFIDEIRAQLKYLGENQSYITKNLRIPAKRLLCLMNSKAKFKPDEIEGIKKLLGI